MKITDELLEQYAPRAAEELLEELPDDADLPPHSFSPEFEQRVRHMEQRARPQRRWMRGAAAAVLACALLGGLASTPAGAYVYRQVWSFFTVLVSPDDTAPAAAPVSFGYLPEGLEPVSQEEISDGQWIVSFQSEDGVRLDVIQMPLSAEGDYHRELSTDGTVETVELDGVTYWIFTESGQTSLYWFRGSSEFVAVGTLDRETLLLVAKNIS